MSKCWPWAHHWHRAQWEDWENPNDCKWQFSPKNESIRKKEKVLGQWCCKCKKEYAPRYIRGWGMVPGSLKVAE